MRPQDHAVATADILGHGFLEVHQWIDRFAPQTRPDGTRYFDKYHRKVQHHAEGVEACRALFGDIGALVMKLHLYQDMGAMFPVDANWRIAKDTADFVKQGLV